jgi:hypothetical protein
MFQRIRTETITPSILNDAEGDLSKLFYLIALLGITEVDVSIAAKVEAETSGFASRAWRYKSQPVKSDASKKARRKRNS